VQLKVAAKLPKCTFSSTSSAVRVSPYKYWYAERFALLSGRSGSGYSQLLQVEYICCKPLHLLFNSWFHCGRFLAA
jgi:hypothetical protein